MKKILLILVVILLVKKVTAQQDVFKFNSPISPSPTAASLGKYGEIPVSTYTGVPNIQIPLYDIKVGANSIPIGISYHAGGLKVSQESSTIGLGWSLNAGGVITRVKKMKDDLSAVGYFKNSTHSASDGKDKEPDMFFFNFANFSGKFLIDYAANVTQPYEIRRMGTYDDDKLKITLVNNNSWLIIDKYGVKYEFSATEIQNDNSATVGNFYSTNDSENYISAWFLSKITYTNGEEILFNYTTGAKIENVPQIDLVYGVGRGYVTNVSFDCHQLTGPRNDLSKTIYNVKVNTINLSEIIFPGGKIEVNYLADRIDLRSAIGLAQRVSAVKVYNKLQTSYNLLKTVNFSHSYFSSSSNANYLSKRLKLDKITEIGNSAGQSKEYEFNYSPINLPDKDSKDIDHWGYYNGPKNNVDLFPTGNSRNPDPTYVKANILWRIQYPSKLYTQFDFEINDFANLGNSLDWSTPNQAASGMIGAGVRVKSISNFDMMDNNISTLKQFEYTLSNGTQSSGKIMSKINYSRPYESTFTLNFNGVCAGYSGWPITETGTSSYTSSSIPISGDAQGNVIGYDRVVIKDVGSGQTTKTIDEFHNISSAASALLYARVPAVNNNYNGLLKLRTDYVNLGIQEVPVKQLELDYTIKNSSTTKGYMLVSGWRSGTVVLADYDIISNWIVNSKVTERIFEANTNNSSIAKVSTIAYDDVSKQRKQEEHTDSKGDVLMVKYKYPTDMVLLG